MRGFIVWGLGLVMVLGGMELYAAGEAWEVKTQCDMPGPSLKDTKAASQEECQALCSETPGCKAALYITGWRKCSLKANAKTARLQFISGEMDGNHAYRPGSYKIDHDHTGKDLERKVLGTADECGKACAENTNCGAFTYLEGYKVCWLKKAGGKFNPKIFSCSIRKNPL